MIDSRSPLSDADLLDLVQRETLRYFWDFAHPESGMARERSNPVPQYDYRDTAASGGTGFGLMALLAGAQRGLLPRAEGLDRLRAFVAFLGPAETHPAASPPFLPCGTRPTLPLPPTEPCCALLS